MAADPHAPATLPCLTNVAQIRALTAEAAGYGYPVRVRATVTFNNLGGLCFVQDSSGAVFVQAKPDSKSLRLGQLVELEGTTRSGDWAPIVRETRFTVLGEGSLPAPKAVSFDELASGKSDCQWVEVHGIVRQARPAGDHLHLELAVGGGRLRAYLYDYPAKGSSALVNSAVCLRGAVGSIFNHKKQFAAPLLFVSGTNNLRVEEASAADPFQAPMLAARALLQYAPGVDYAHRVKVSGVVTYQEPGRSVFLRDGVQGLRVETQSTLPVQPGDTVEAVGFPVMGQYSPALEDALLRVTGSGAPPRPVHSTVEQALKGGMDANFITLEAQMLDLIRRGSERILALQASNVIFNARLPQGALPPVGVEKGSRLQVSGICSIREVQERVSFLNPQSFELLLRSPQDIVVLERPPWWTLSRLMWIVGAMAVVLLIGVAWVVVLNRRVSEQTQIIHERVQREAVLEERSRIAREFHDTLEQEMAGIALQLDTVAVHLKTSPPLAAQQLELARNLSRHTLAEARRSVWDLRSHLLGNGDLTAALTEVARPFGNAQVRIEVQSSGTPRRLSARVENNLLRIAQEALTNALKHARPHTVRLSLDYQPERVCLDIQDDGVGFELSQAPGIGSGHFGLLGMRERAERAGAAFWLRSSPGTGTHIKVEVPEKPSAPG